MKLRNLIKSAVYRLATLLFGDKENYLLTPIIQGPNKGLWFRVNLVQKREAYWHGQYDEEILTVLARDFIQPGMTVWDCGIYIGYYTCFFARQVGPSGHVVAFEPDPSCLARAQENIRLNGFSNTSWVHAAIGDMTGKSAFILSGNTNSHLPGGWIGATADEYKDQVETRVGVSEVQVYTLDDALNQCDVPAPDLVKIDIEGMEGKAVQHTRQLIELHRPIFVVELHNPECDRQVWEFFHQQGYDIINAATLQPVLSVEESRETLICTPRRR